MDISTTPLDVAERALIGAAMDRRRAQLDELDLDPADFKDFRAELAYRHILAMDAAGKPIDPATVADDVRAAGDPDLRGIDFPYLLECWETNTNFGLVPAYAGIVKTEAVRRRVERAGRSIVEAAREGMPADDLVDLARREVDAAGRVDSSALTSTADSMAETLQAIRNPRRGVLSPWADLNTKTGGMVGGRLYVVGARPSVGKSVIALQLGLNLAAHGNVAYFSLEMGKDELNRRIMAHDLKIGMQGLMDGNLRPDQQDALDRYVATRPHPGLIVDDSSTVNFATIRKQARSLARGGNLAGVVVDYLQLISPDRGERRPRHEVVAELSRNLKILSRELDVPVIALSQLNRGVTDRADAMPRISDLRESGAVEQDADVVILLHREVMGDKAGELKVLVAKNRQGPAGSFDLDFYGHYSRAASAGSHI